METLRALNREQGVTIVVVTHEADIAAYADRVADDARRRDRLRRSASRAADGRATRRAGAGRWRRPRAAPRRRGAPGAVWAFAR